MNLSVTPLALFSSLVMGAFAAYFAHKRGKNPFLWFAIGAFFGVFGIFAFLLATEKKQRQKTAIPERVLTIQGPKDKFWYYLDPENNQQGPMSYSALTTAWKEGKVTPSSYVWNEELPEWKLLKEITN